MALIQLLGIETTLRDRYEIGGTKISKKKSGFLTQGYVLQEEKSWNVLNDLGRTGCPVLINN